MWLSPFSKVFALRKGAQGRHVFFASKDKKVINQSDCKRLLLKWVQAVSE